MTLKIAPSILSADFLDLGKDIEMLNRSEADWIHVDVMDGVFVPNVSFGFPVIEAVAAIAKSTQMASDDHSAERYIEQFIKAGAQQYGIHYEGANLNRTVNHIKNWVQSWRELNPHTSVDVLKDIIADLDYVLLMSVNPGHGGQKFIYAHSKSRP